MERINEVDFDVFNYFRLVGSREDAFELGMRRMVEPFYSQVKEQDAKFKLFLTRVSGGYREFNVSYHNDLHAFDVT